MTKNIVAGVLVIAALFIGYAGGARGLVGAVATGQQHYSLENFQVGLTAGPRGLFAISKTGKTVTVGTSNTSTSTLAVGCIQAYATSTATPIKQMFFASTTIGGSVIAAGFGGGTAQGFVLWGYGSCPNL